MARSRTGATEAAGRTRTGPSAARTRPAPVERQRLIAATLPPGVDGSRREGEAQWRLPTARQAGRAGATVTIQDTPKRSATMPKRDEKKVGAIGICTWPPSARAAKTFSASASLAVS